MFQQGMPKPGWMDTPDSPGSDPKFKVSQIKAVLCRIYVLLTLFAGWRGASPGPTLHRLQGGICWIPLSHDLKGSLQYLDF